MAGTIRPARCGLLRAYLDRAGIGDGPIFRPTTVGETRDRELTGRTVANVVKRAAALVGKEPGSFAGHSLRRGFRHRGGAQRRVGAGHC